MPCEEKSTDFYRRPRTGWALKVEFYLCRSGSEPSMRNADVLAAIEDEWSPEWGRFTSRSHGAAAAGRGRRWQMERLMAGQLTTGPTCGRAARQVPRLAMIGILPRLGEQHHRGRPVAQPR